MAHHIKREDIAAMVEFRSGDVILEMTDNYPLLQVPLFLKGENTGYLVSVRLSPDHRPSISWSTDRSQMYEQYTMEGSTVAFADGTYDLDSHQDYTLIITNGVPTRADFRALSADNRAWCCPDAKAFILEDPSVDNKKSIYVQVTDQLLVECSASGKVFLWRRQAP